MAAYRYAIPELRDNNHSLIRRTSVAIAYQATRAFNFVVDTGVARNAQAASNKIPAFLIVGLVYMPTKQVDLDFGLRRGFRVAEAERQCGAGYTIRF